MAAAPVGGDGTVGGDDDVGTGFVTNLGGDLGVAGAFAAAEGDVEGAEAVGCQDAGAGVELEGTALEEAQGVAQYFFADGAAGVSWAGEEPRGMFGIGTGLAPAGEGAEAIGQGRVNEGEGVDAGLAAVKPEMGRGIVLGAAGALPYRGQWRVDEACFALSCIPAEADDFGGGFVAISREFEVYQKIFKKHVDT